jgi:hypothetical protein
VDNRIEVDESRHIMMRNGFFQGVVSSECFYSVVKKWVITNAIKGLLIETHYKAKIYFQIDYVDDGIQIIGIAYLHIFIRILICEYKKCGMELNLLKTKIILITNNITYKCTIEQLAQQFGFKYNFVGNYTF